MGPAKSKHLSLHHDHDDPEGELGHLRRIESSKEERRRRRKWRKKQGYSLPTGIDMVGRISAASSQPDLPGMGSTLSVFDKKLFSCYLTVNYCIIKAMQPLFSLYSMQEEKSIKI